MLRSFVIALTFVLVSVSAFAADTATVNVQAIVQGTCLFDTNAYSMNFPVIDPGVTTGDVTASVNLAFTCNNGTPITLDDVSGAQTLTSGSGNLAYAIDAYAASVPAAGTGGTQTVTITGRIAEAAYSVAAADTYIDTLTININP